MSARNIEALLVNPEYTRKIFELQDGRKLSYSECGNIATGFPVLFQFGLMASSLAVMMFHEESIHLVLRVIAVDYPGIGDSSIVLHRTLVGWAIDMDEFCQEMFGDSRIAILSHCMGGPHAISMLYHARLSQRIRSVTLVSPWLPLEHSIESPWLFDVARHLPSVIQDNFIPFFATTMTNSSLTMAGSIAMCSNNSARMLVVQEITGYGKFQGQDGNRQMVRLALETIEIKTLPAHISVFVFHGKKDKLVHEGACLHLIKSWKDNSPTFVSFEKADHNTALANDNLYTVLSTVVEEERNVKSE